MACHGILDFPTENGICPVWQDLEYLPVAFTWWTQSHCRCATSATRRGPRWAARSADAAAATTSSARSATTPPSRPTRSKASTGTHPAPARGWGFLGWGLKGLVGKEMSSPLLKRCFILWLQTVGEMLSFPRKASLQWEGICLVLEPVTSLKGNKAKTESVLTDSLS